MKKILMVLVAVVILGGGAYFIWKLGLLNKAGNFLPSSGGDSGIGAPENPLENLPDVNPVQKTNPFSDVKTNPFD